MIAEKLISFSGIIVASLFVFYFLAFRRIEKKGRRFIVAGMLVVLFTFVYDFLLLENVNEFTIWFFPIYFPLVFSLYPIIYHYLVVAIGDKNERLLVKVFTYLPILILAINLIYFLPLDHASKINFVFGTLGEVVLSYNSFSDYIVIIHSLYYAQLIIFTFIFYQLYFFNRSIEHDKDSEKKLTLPQWLFLFVSIIILYEIFFLLQFLFDLDTIPNYINQAVNLAVLLFIGFLGIQHDEMILMMRMEQFSSTIKRKELNLKLSSKNDEVKAKKILDEARKLIVEQKLFLNPALKIEHIARKNHIPIKNLSEIINKYECKNFSQFINFYRIEYAKNILLENDDDFKIQDICFEVGFYSRSTFNRAFKLIVKKTPTEFLNSNSKSSL